MSDGPFKTGDTVQCRLYLEDEWLAGTVAAPPVPERTPPEWTLVRLGGPRPRQVWFRTEGLRRASGSEPATPTESNLVTHARRELALLGKTDEWFTDSVVGAVRAFAADGQHSGESAANAIDLLARLLRREALTPLTDDIAEWRDVTKEGEQPGWWQNVRDLHALSRDGGRTYWRVDDMVRRWPRQKQKMYRSQPSLREDDDG